MTTFCRLDELGLEAVGQRLEPDQAVLACGSWSRGQWCHRCGCAGTPRDRPESVTYATVLAPRPCWPTNLGKVDITEPRDWAGTVEPVIAPKHHRKLGSVKQVVLSRTAGQGEGAKYWLAVVTELKNRRDSLPIWLFRVAVG